MKTNRMFLLLFLIAGLTGANAQSTTLESEVPGDNFSLEGALELFKKSASPEEFEKRLNAADSKVNNLDLNSDGNIDYIRVIDRNEGNVHAFILQAVLSSSESQDVAVIELEKLEDGRAVLQIVGDADVYGIETIIEPTDEVRINAGTMTSRAVVNVWTWPSVQYVYGPYYSVWVSPWSWAYHPFWWRPWRPVAFHVYHPWWNPYRSYYSHCYSHRVFYGPGLYRPYRTTSVIVYNNYGRQIDGYRSRNDRYHGRRDDNGRGRFDGGRYSERGRTSDSRYSPRDRSDGRERFADNSRSRTLSDDRSGRSRYDINRPSERRSSTDRSYDNGRSRVTAPEKSIDRSSRTFSSPNRTGRSTNMNSGSSQRVEKQIRTSQPRSTPSYSNPGGRQQRSSSPSFNGGSSGGSRPSYNGGSSGGSKPSFNGGSGGGGRQSGGGRSSGGGGDRGGSRNSRGRH